MPNVTLKCHLTVTVTEKEVARFKETWPCSGLHDKEYWFTFDADENLVDSNVGEDDDGDAARALSQDCQEYLFCQVMPVWQDGPWDNLGGK
jgi:hypothetical protein